MSRQREYQKRQMALGNCIKCGKPRHGTSTTLCEIHRVMENEAARRRWKHRLDKAKAAR